MPAEFILCEADADERTDSVDEVEEEDVYDIDKFELDFWNFWFCSY